MSFKGPHNFMITSLGYSVKWLLGKSLPDLDIMDLKCVFTFGGKDLIHGTDIRPDTDYHVLNTSTQT
jgi:hypothetical protein